MRDLIRNTPIKSFDDFNSRFSLNLLVRGAKTRSDLTQVAYKALVALERGRRDEYLDLRRKLTDLHLKATGDAMPEFRHDDQYGDLNWMQVMIITLSTRALALGFDAEESSWETIYPGQSRLSRMVMTEDMWNQAQADPNREHGQAVIEMMNFRIGQVISTGSKKQPLISILLESQPELMEQFADASAKHEQERLKTALRRQRRERNHVEAIRAEVASEADAGASESLTVGAEVAVGRPVVALRL